MRRKKGWLTQGVTAAAADFQVTQLAPLLSFICISYSSLVLSLTLCSVPRLFRTFSLTLPCHGGTMRMLGHVLRDFQKSPSFFALDCCATATSLFRSISPLLWLSSPCCYGRGGNARVGEGDENSASHFIYLGKWGHASHAKRGHDSGGIEAVPSDRTRAFIFSSM